MKAQKGELPFICLDIGKTFFMIGGNAMSMKKVISALLCGALMAGCLMIPVHAEEEFGSNPSGEVTIWGWDETEVLKDELAEVYPDVTINYVTIAQADFPQKIQTTLASGAQMPDIIQLEATTRGKMYSLGCWENLSEAPYNVDKNIFTVDQLPVSVGR